MITAKEKIRVTGPQTWKSKKTSTGELLHD